MAAAGSNSKPMEILKVYDEDLIEVGMLPREPKPEKAKPKLKFVPIDPKDLEEIQTEFAEQELRRMSTSKGFSTLKANSTKKESSVTKRKYSTITRRLSHDKKEIAKKAVVNIRKLENHRNTGDKPLVRKNLFRLSTMKDRITTTKSYNGRELFKVTNSPLMDINTAESLLKKNHSISVLGKQVQSEPKITKASLSTVVEEDSFTPSTSGNSSNGLSDSSDFEKLEKMCNTQEINDKIRQIMNIIKTDREELEKYKSDSEKRMSQITSILETIVTANDKQNKSKKSITPKRSLKKTETGDSLRRNVLRKSIGKTQGNTPKLKKAEKMYNKLKETYGILETPKFDKKTNGGTNISQKLQEQCLMLLDTPR